MTARPAAGRKPPLPEGGGMPDAGGVPYVGGVPSPRGTSVSTRIHAG